MVKEITIKSALISVYHKDEVLEGIVKKMQKLGIKIYSTGGTMNYLESLGVEVTAVESLTGYPSIFGGRVKTLHPKVFGGILYRRDEEGDLQEAQKYEIPSIDLVVVDLYPFEDTLDAGATNAELIEKIDIGGISLIRAAAKNFASVLVVPAQAWYEDLNAILDKGGKTTWEERKQAAANALFVSSEYDALIASTIESMDLNNEGKFEEKDPMDLRMHLRYGENPHQKASYFGNFEQALTKLHGKELSYNNLLDIEAAVMLVREFEGKTVAILKHNNACGLATADNYLDAWKRALAADPVSAFGGIIVVNGHVEEDLAKEIDALFYEILIAKEFSDEALSILQAKKNRILLQLNPEWEPESAFERTWLLGGTLFQEVDLQTETAEDLTPVTNLKPSDKEVADLLYANKIVKHSKSNAIVLVKDQQLIGSGVGQMSRVDALEQAITKAKKFGYDLKGAVMASDAFFPFPDCVNIAAAAGITAIIQPGGSVNDKLSVEAANQLNISMVTTGRRHFKH